MGIVNAGLDQYNLNNDYGAMAQDRTHLLNFAYSIELPSPAHGRLAAGIVNGWQLSGVTQLESGPNLSALTSENFGANYGQALLPNGFAVSNESIVGTKDLQLNPVVTCNPTANLQPHQFVNCACFGLPSPGHYGPSVLPAYYGSWFFNIRIWVCSRTSRSKNQ
jgi:hypothetical protein